MSIHVDEDGGFSIFNEDVDVCFKKNHFFYSENM